MVDEAAVDMALPIVTDDGVVITRLDVVFAVFVVAVGVMALDVVSFVDMLTVVELTQTQEHGQVWLQHSENVDMITVHVIARCQCMVSLLDG